MKKEEQFLKTDQSIQKTYVELVRKNKNKDKVTVKSICDALDISRGTFYLHFETLDQLVESLENEYARKLMDSVRVYNYDKDTTVFFDALFSAVENNPDLFYFYFYLSKGQGIEIFQQFLYREMLPEWLKASKLTGREAEIGMRFLLDGTMGLLQEWFENDFKDKELYRGVLNRFVKYGLYSAVYLDQEDPDLAESSPAPINA